LWQGTCGDLNNRLQGTNGSTTCTPAFAKSMRLRVATARLCTIAVAAIRLSLIGIVSPVLRRRASSSAHVRPVSASQGRQWRRPAPASNQRSSAGPLLSCRKDKNAEAQFPENHRIDRHVSLVCAKPVHNARIRRRFRRLAQNVGVNQMLHRVSVDSDSMGTKKSLYGQASSQSMVPSFLGETRRTRR
jgi:hypothetical protein